MKQNKSKKGFTLVELIIVIAILAILAVAAIAGYINLSASAEEAVIQSNAGAVSRAITNYNHIATDKVLVWQDVLDRFGDSSNAANNILDLQAGAYDFSIDMTAVLKALGADPALTYANKIIILGDFKGYLIEPAEDSGNITWTVDETYRRP